MGSRTESQEFLMARARAVQALVPYKEVADQLHGIIDAGADPKERPAKVRALIEQMELFNAALSHLRRVVTDDLKQS